MAERYVVRERVRIYYESKRLATGLTDVKIDIVKTDGNKEIDSADMTELNSTNAPGIYYYDWVPTNAGTYLCYIDAVSDDYKRTMTSQLDIVGRSSKYTQVMGVHGGMSTNRVTVRDTWTDKEKNDLLSTLDKLSTRLDLMSASISGLGVNIDNQSSRIIKLREDNEKSKDILRLNQITTMEQINHKLGELDTRIEMNIAKQTIGSKQIENSFKNTHSELSLLKESNNSLKSDIQGQINLLKGQYSDVLDNFNHLNNRFQELRNDIEESHQLKEKLLKAKESLTAQKKMLRDIAKNLGESEEIIDKKISIEPEMFSIEKLNGGIQVSVHKDDKVIIYSENKEDITSSYPILSEEIKKLSDSPFILNCELISEGDKSKLIVNDILYFDEPINSLSLKERLNYLNNFKSNELIVNSDRKIVEKNKINELISSINNDELKGLIIKPMNEPYLINENASVYLIKKENEASKA